MTSTLSLQVRRDSTAGDEEFDEADMWGEGPADDHDESRSSSDEEIAEEGNQEKAFGGDAMR